VSAGITEILKSFTPSQTACLLNKLTSVNDGSANVAQNVNLGVGLSAKIADGFTLDLMIQFTASVDFSAGTDGTVDYTLPFGTLATSRGVVCVKITSTFPNNAIFGEEKNSTIRVQCNDNTFVDDIVITAFIQVKLN